MFEFTGYIANDTIYIEVRYNGEVIDTKQFWGGFNPTINGIEYKGVEAGIKSIQADMVLHDGYYDSNYNFYPQTKSSNATTTNTTTDSYNNNITTNTNSGTTSGNTFSLGTEELTGTITDIQDNITKLQEIGMPSITNTTKDAWKVVEKNLMSKRQIAKKVLLITNPTITEEEAHLQVYGKLYYVNNSLLYNDDDYPDSISKPTDENYYPPLNEKHPLWKKIEKWIKDLKDSIIQLGIKLGEFINLIADTIQTIALAITSLLSSVFILPFGAGMPTAMTAVKTVMVAIKKLQSKVSELFPLLSAFDIIGFLLPSIAIISGIISLLILIFKGISALIESLIGILGFLSILEALFNKIKKKFDSIPFKVTAKANPSSVKINEESTLSAEASGGDYDYKFEWTDEYGNIIQNNSVEDDDGTRLLTPYIPHNTTFPGILQRDISKYTVKLTDGKGNIATSTVEISRS